MAKPRIEQGKTPRERKSKWGFEEMKEGDSFYFDVKPQQIAISYGYYLSRGKYTIEKEGDGYRFYLNKRKGGSKK